MAWKIVFSTEAQKDTQKIKSYHLSKKVSFLLELIINDPFIKSPPYEKLVGDLQGLYSRRINLQHRLIYQVFKKEKIIKILSMWSHYE